MVTLVDLVAEGDFAFEKEKVDEELSLFRSALEVLSESLVRECASVSLEEHLEELGFVSFELGWLVH